MKCCSKSGILKYAPNSHIHVQIIHRVVMFSSVDFPDDREDCFRMVNCDWRHVLMVWPYFSFSFWTSLAVWFTGCIGLLRSCFMCNGPLRHCLFLAPGSVFGKVHIPWLLFCCDRFPSCCVHQPAKVCILQSHLRTRRYVGLILLSGFSVAMSIPGLFDAIGLFADAELVGTCEDKFIAVDFDFAIFLSSLFCSCIRFAIVLGQLIKLGFLAQQAELKWLMLNKWRRLFHSSRVKLPLLKMFASWCLVSMYRIWILESRLIVSNNQAKATLWVLDMCLTVGLRPLIIILMTASLSQKYQARRQSEEIFRFTKTNSIALEPECVNRTPPHRVVSRTFAHISSLFTCTAWLKVLQRVSHKNMFIHMSSCVWLCVVSPPIDLFLSFECLNILSILFTSFLLFILHVVGTARVQEPCAHADWGVLPRGDTQPSHRLWVQPARQLRLLRVFCKALLLASEHPTFYDYFWWCVWILHPQVQWRRYHATVWRNRGLVSRQPTFVLFCLSLQQTYASTFLAVHCQVLRLFVSS